MFCFCFLFLAFYLIRFFSSPVVTILLLPLSTSLSLHLLSFKCSFRRWRGKKIETRAHIFYAFEAIQIKFKIIILNCKFIQIKPILTASLVSTYRNPVTIYNFHLFRRSCVYRKNNLLPTGWHVLRPHQTEVHNFPKPLLLPARKKICRFDSNETQHCWRQDFHVVGINTFDGCLPFSLLFIGSNVTYLNYYYKFFFSFHTSPWTIFRLLYGQVEIYSLINIIAFQQTLKKNKITTATAKRNVV